MVGVDFPEGIHHLHVTVPAEDLFLCPANGELAPVLDVLGNSQAESPEAGLGQVR